MPYKKILIIIVLAVLAFLAFAVYGLYRYNNPQAAYNNQAITSFTDCANAGYPVMESYPRQCRSASGELFVEKISNPN